MLERRRLLGQLTAAAFATALDVDEFRASSQQPTSKWDTSWIDTLASAQYRAVFNATDIPNLAAYYAAMFLNDFHEVHGTSVNQTRAVIVLRRLATPMAFNDAMWAKYPLGEHTRAQDETTHAPARRNVFWKPTAQDSSAETLETLARRGVIYLVCNVSTMGVGYQMAQKVTRDADEVRTDLKANLIPGAILVPSGVYGLIRAQNAGCAYMLGTGEPLMMKPPPPA